jgi:hypothetical protein
VTLTKPVEAEDRIDQFANCHLLSTPKSQRSSVSVASAIDVSITLLLHLCKGVLEIAVFETALL